MEGQLIYFFWVNVPHIRGIAFTERYYNISMVTFILPV